MGTTLSPESYLRYPVQRRGESRMYQTRGSKHRKKIAGADAILVQTEPETFERYMELVLQILRAERFNYFCVDTEKLERTDDIAETYCLPVVEVANREFLHPEVPTLRFYSKDRDNGAGRKLRIAYLAMHKLDADPDTLTWHLADHTSDRLLRWDKHKKCMGVAVWMPVGSLNKEDFVVPTEVPLETSQAVYRALKLLSTLVDEHAAPYGVLTDEVVSVVMERNSIVDKRAMQVWAYSADETPLRLILAACFYKEAINWTLCRCRSLGNSILCRGALQSPDQLRTSFTQDTSILTATKRWFADFDMYTMQRVREAWNEFSRWKDYVRQQAKDNPIVPGMMLSVEVGAFFRAYSRHRSPYPLVPLPPDTLASVTRFSRPRNSEIDDILLKSDIVQFKIAENKRVGPNQFSQVFFGRLAGCDELLCFKVYDERHFDIPEDNTPDYHFTPAEYRLTSVNNSEDLVRREEAAYDRLSHLQGTLIPHSYGFHLVTLPDGWQAYGMLMEYIPGVSLGDYATSGLSPAQQIALTTSMRHAVRAIKYAGVSQTDWHVNQAICSGLDPDFPDIVLIDLAFAHLWLGDDGGAHPTRDVYDVYEMLIVDFNIDMDIIRRYWVPELEYEH